MSLEEIAKKHGTFKVYQGYMPIYEKFFAPLKNDRINLLEIGVHEGASLKTWNDYFKQAWVVGMDTTVTEKAKESLIHIIEGDASKDFDKLPPVDWDIIIDDGSHLQDEVMNSFWGLWDSVKPGGYYVIEDLFAAFDPVWNPQGPRIVREINARMEKILIGGDSIQEVHWFGRNDINGILFLMKRYEDFRIQPLSEFK